MLPAAKDALLFSSAFIRCSFCNICTDSSVRSIVAGYQSIFDKVNLAKPNTKVTTPITSTINALKSLKIKRLSIFTPYTDEINQSVIN